MTLAIATQVKSWIETAVLQGGERQRAARKAEAIIGALSIGRDPEQVIGALKKWLSGDAGKQEKNLLEAVMLMEWMNVPDEKLLLRLPWT